MKLYVVRNSRKVYLKTKARTKKELLRKIGRPYFYIRNGRFYIKEVKAERESSDSRSGFI